MSRRKKARLDNMKKKPKKVIIEKVIGYPVQQSEYTVTMKDATIYSLGIGFIDPCNQEHLKFTYENHPKFSIFPSFCNTYPCPQLVDSLTRCPGLPRFNVFRMLHGEQETQYFNEIQPHLKLMTRGTFIDLVDKKKYSLIRVQVKTYQEDNMGGDPKLIAISTAGVILRGANLCGFGFHGVPGL